MEQEHQTSSKPDGMEESATPVTNAPTSEAATPAETTFEGEQTFEQLMASSPTLSPFTGWLKCLRKPAISVEYSMRKRHVPDMDQNSPQNGQNGGGASASPSSRNGQSTQNRNGQNAVGKNADAMDVSGSFTIRYFDFALGILGLAIVSCISKGCVCLKRKMK